MNPTRLFDCVSCLTFGQSVPIPATGIRGKQVQLDLELARKRLADPPREERAHVFAVLSTLAAEAAAADATARHLSPSNVDERDDCGGFIRPCRCGSPHAGNTG